MLQMKKLIFVAVLLIVAMIGCKNNEVKKEIISAKPDSNAVIVMAMHGALPTDFPMPELQELFKLTGMLEGMGKDKMSKESLDKLTNLEEKMLNWKLTEANNPFYFSSLELANKVREKSGLKVVCSFNEFSRPTVSDALDSAAKMNAKQIYVITPMLTKGGSHAEKEIPEKFEEFMKKHPDVKVKYVWPMDSDDIAQFLVGQYQKQLAK